MPNLLDLSARIIDAGHADEPVNRVTQKLSEVADGVSVVESFSHVVTFDAGESLVSFDASGIASGPLCVMALRGWRTSPVSHLVYTHGHMDHVGGGRAFLVDAAERGHPAPTVVAHEAVPRRIDRYRRTDGWNRHINQRQFGWQRGSKLALGAMRQFVPDDLAEPDTLYERSMTLDVDGLTFELVHGMGETDDHTWAWVPLHKAICAGDFLIWNFPNAGNPQKVQRFPEEWAACLRDMAAREPELFLPAHGLPIAGRERIARVLDEVATALEFVVSETVAMMNDGCDLDEIVHTVRVPDDTLAKPYLRPLYDEPEFVVRGVWRRYGGWWDGNASRLKPAPDDAVAAEVAALAGGAAALAARALSLSESGDHRLACHLAEWAARAAGDSSEVRSVCADVYQARFKVESSLMAKGIFADAARRAAGD